MAFPPVQHLLLHFASFKSVVFNRYQHTESTILHLVSEIVTFILLLTGPLTRNMTDSPRVRVSINVPLLVYKGPL